MCATPKTSSPSRALGPTYVACARRRSRSGQSGVRVVVVARARRARARSRALDAVGARVAASRRRSSRAPCRGAARRRKTARARRAPAVSRRARGWTVSSNVGVFGRTLRALLNTHTERSVAAGTGRYTDARGVAMTARRERARARRRRRVALIACACALAVICARAVTPRRARERRADARTPRELTLASHGAFLALDVESKAARVIHRGRGVYYGTFEDGSSSSDAVWVASRPDNAKTRAATRGDALLRIDAKRGEILEERAIDAAFTHDVVRRGDSVFVADTGNGRILELEYPSMRTLRAVELSVKAHVNTLAPADASEYGEHAVWAVLHNLGPSEVALIDLETGRELRPRLTRVGTKSHGLVIYEDRFIMLNSGEGQLISVDPSGVEDYEILWTDDSRTFMKGLCVIDDVAFFGVSAFGRREDRGDPNKSSDVVAFDLVRKRELWRQTVMTHGLLNVIAAPQIESSTWSHAHWNANSPSLYAEWIPLAAKQTNNCEATDRNSLLLTYDDVDVHLLRDYIQGLPRDVFKESGKNGNALLGGRDGNMQKFKPNVDGMLLFFSDRSGEHVFEFPFWKRLEPYVQPVLIDLFTDQLGVSDPLRHVIRLQLAVMNPGSEILPHVDTGDWARRHHRFHVPIIVPQNAGAVEFVMMPESGQEIAVPLIEGRPFEINNAVTHRVRNSASSWRIHLLVDFSEQPTAKRHVLKPGDVCDYAKMGSGRCVAVT